MSRDELRFKVEKIDVISNRSGAETEFEVGDEFSYEELATAIKYGCETINGYVDYEIGDFGEISLTFVGYGDEDYEDNCVVTFSVSVSANTVEDALNAIL